MLGDKRPTSSGQGTVIGANVKLIGTLQDANDIVVHGRIEGEIISSQAISITESSYVKGPISADLVTIAGKVRGSITATGKLEILPTGRVYGSITSKDLSGDLGIAGEAVSPSAARTIEELTHLGVVKGYSTIVACGSEMLVNKVITVLATEKMAKETVLGIIPDDFNSLLAERLGLKDIFSACNALKYRKLETINLCLIEPNKYFLTEAIIESPRNQEIFFSVEKLQGRA